MFAVVLQGVGDGHKRLEKLSRAAHAAVGRKYAPVYPPHVTLGVFNSGRFEQACPLGAQLVRTSAPIRVTISTLSLFPAGPGVLAAGPVPCDALITLHRRFEATYAAFERCREPYWGREDWVPHVTLLSPLRASDQGRAIAALVRDWQPFVFTLSALSVVRLPDVETRLTMRLVARSK